MSQRDIYIIRFDTFVILKPIIACRLEKGVIGCYVIQDFNRLKDSKVNTLAEEYDALHNTV